MFTDRALVNTINTTALCEEYYYTPVTNVNHTLISSVKITYVNGCN